LSHDLNGGMTTIASPGVTSRSCASTSPDTSRCLRSSSANSSPPTTCWMCRKAAISGIQSSSVDWSGLESAVVVCLGALAMGRSVAPVWPVETTHVSTGLLF
jgi:hypothetical protein